LTQESEEIGKESLFCEKPSKANDDELEMTLK
jgi:hypothetical protein